MHHVFKSCGRLKTKRKGKASDFFAMFGGGGDKRRAVNMDHIDMGSG